MNESANDTITSELMVETSALSSKADLSLEVAREDILKQLFGEVGVLLNDFSCAVETSLLLHGRMYVTNRFLCFYSNLFGMEKKIRIPYSHITNIAKENTALVIPNAIAITTYRKSYLFRSFWDRDECFRVLKEYAEKYKNGKEADAANVRANSQTPRSSSSLALRQRSRSVTTGGTTANSSSITAAVKPPSSPAAGKQQHVTTVSSAYRAEPTGASYLHTAQSKSAGALQANIGSYGQTEPTSNNSGRSSDTNSESHETGTIHHPANLPAGVLAALSDTNPEAFDDDETDTCYDVSNNSVKSTSRSRASSVADNISPVASSSSSSDKGAAASLADLTVAYEADRARSRLHNVVVTDTLPLKVWQFAALFVEDKAPYGWKSYHESVNDTNVEISSWAKMPDDSGFGYFREMKFFKPVNLPGLKSTRGVKVQRYRRFGDFGLILCSSTRLEDVPAADTFSVEKMIAVKALSDDQISIEITFEVKFIKTTMFKYVIEHSTNAEMFKWLEQFFFNLKQKSVVGKKLLLPVEQQEPAAVATRQRQTSTSSMSSSASSSSASLAGAGSSSAQPVQQLSAAAGEHKARGDSVSTAVNGSKGTTPSPQEEDIISMTTTSQSTGTAASTVKVRENDKEKEKEKHRSGAHSRVGAAAGSSSKRSGPPVGGTGGPPFTVSLLQVGIAATVVALVLTFFSVRLSLQLDSLEKKLDSVQSHLAKMSSDLEDMKKYRSS